MNSFVNESNVTLYLSEAYYLQIGSTTLIDSFYLFLLFPIMLSGVFLNLNAIETFFKIDIAETVIYKYMRIYSLNSLFVNLLSIFTLYTLAPRYFIEANYWMARILRCKLVPFVITGLLFYGNLMDILVGLERLSLFKTNLKCLMRISYIKLSLFLFGICFFIHIPFAFYKVKSDQDWMDETRNAETLKKFVYCQIEPLFDNLIGFYIMSIVLFIEKFLTIIIELIMNITCIFYYRKFLIKKLEIKRRSTYLNATKQDSKDVKIRRDQENNRLKEKNLFIMFLYLSSISILSNSVIVISYVLYVYFTQNMIRFWFLLITYLSFTLKHWSNFFVFFKFNNKFRQVFREKSLIGRLLFRD